MKVTNNSPEQVRGAHVHSAKSGAPASKTEKSGEAHASAPAGAAEGDTRTEISGKARELAQAKEVASNTPDVREEKIAKLREMISAGKYKVDPQAVADRMVDEHLSSGIG